MKNIITIIAIACSLGFVGCAQKPEKPEEKVKEVVDNFIEALKSGDSSLAREYVMPEDEMDEDEMDSNLIEALVRITKEDKKCWEDVTLDAFQICVEEDEAVVVVPVDRKNEKGYFNFYLKDIDEKGNWKICSFFGGKEHISCTVKGYKKAEKEMLAEILEKVEASYVAAAKSDVQTLKTAVFLYYTEKRKYPKSLKDLIVAENGAEPYLEGGESVLIDPWGNKYELRMVKRKVSVLSAGPDGLFGTDDDIDSSRAHKK